MVNFVGEREGNWGRGTRGEGRSGLHMVESEALIVGLVSGISRSVMVPTGRPSS